MGFFKNLFEKKVCDICGEEIGMLGNRKLEDGNCCKDCAKKLSPWFTERKHSTVAEIKQQIADREANRAAVAAFHETRVFGKSTRVLLDEKAGKFMVTSSGNLEKDNPDVLSFDQVTSCEVDVREAKNEVYRQVRDEEGKLKNESYSPRRYKYSYDFWTTIRVNHPYIDDMQFSLSGGYIQVRAQQRMTASSFLFGNRDSGGYGSDGSSTNPPTLEDCRDNDDYVRCERWGRELNEILLHRQPEPERMQGGSAFEPLIANYVRSEEELAAARQSGDKDRTFLAQKAKLDAMNVLYQAYQQDPKGAAAAGVLDVLNRYSEAQQKSPEPEKPRTVCPWCGAETTGGKFCENCGGKLTD